MTRRLAITACLVLIGAGAIALWRGTRPKEPFIEGKPLSRSLEWHTPTSSANPPYNSTGWHKIDVALRKTGTNAIPTLLRMISAKDPPAPVLKVMEMARSRRLLRTRYHYAMLRNEEAEYAFQVLGTNAASAVPALIKIYERAVTPSSQRCAASALGNIGWPAKETIPILLRDLRHTNGDVRFYAVSAIYHIGGEPSVIVPAMISVLTDPKWEVRWNAMWALSRYGHHARAALPALFAARDDPAIVSDPEREKHIETIISRIAPEKVGKPLLVEQTTPMVANGRTIQPLDFMFKGKRITAIKPGTSVPCGAQFWSSEPRGPLTLFRGQKGSTNDHLLGHFEVVGMMPSPTDINISVLCIIVDEQIFLKARDNNREIFLEMRRVDSD